MKRILLLLLLIPFAWSAFAGDSLIVHSPDGRLAFILYSDKAQLMYRIRMKGQDVIEPSRLVVQLDDAALTDAASLGPATRFRIRESYPVLGVHSRAVNQCEGARIPIQTSMGIPFQLEVRVFNDGAAFRETLQPSSGAHVPDEATEFRLSRGSTVWFHDLEMHYEGVHVSRNVEELQEGTWVAPPSTVRLPGGGYACILESDLRDYGGMALQANGASALVLRLPQHQPTSYPYRLRYPAEDTLRLKQPAAIAGNITTPWRVVLAAEDLNTLVNSDVVSNLNPPPDPKLFPKGIATEWIRPGRAVWKYLNGGGEGTPEVMKHFTDAAAALGFEHNILEGFWTRWTDAQLKDLVDYSRKKGVGIWLWKHSKSLRSPASRDSFFRKCHDLGITGVKIDFFDHEAKEVIDLYTAILRETARYHLLVDFHGADKPTGLSRSFPNELTREAVKGMEASKLTDRATHETTLPFTRFLAGPAEYTVLHFGDRRKNTSWAHQIASAAILSAPLLTYAANPDTILANPAADVIRDIPATWDETRVLEPSAIGKLAVYARRKGSTWFLAVMNGTEAATLRIPLDFLGKSPMKARLVRDATDRSDAVQLETKTFSSSDVLELHLAPGGGFLAEFKK